MQIKVKRLTKDAVMPTYATDGAAGFDLYAAEDVVIEPGQTKKIRLGLAFEIPAGYVMFIVPRSGVSLETKLRQPNSVGVIDSDYRGEVSMMFDNIDINNLDEMSVTGVEDLNGNFIHTCERFLECSYVIKRGDRICQGIIQEVPQAEFVEVDELSKTKRGTNGFGSTGV